MSSPGAHPGAAATSSTPPVRGRLRRRRQRPGRQHGRRGAGRRGAKVAVLEEGGHYTRRDFNMQEGWAYPALYQEHGNRATEDLSIIGPAGALRRRRHHRQLDVVVPHAGPDAGAVGSPPRRPGAGRGHAGPALRGRRAAAGARRRQPGRRERQQPQAPGRGGQAGLAPRADPPQREGVRPPRLLRHGLPAGCQAHGAHDLPGRRRRRRRRRVRRLPGDADRKRSRARAAASSPRCWTARPIARAGAWSPTPGAAWCWPGARSTPPPSCCARHAGADSGQVGRRTFLHPTVPSSRFTTSPSKRFTAHRSRSPSTTSPTAAIASGYIFETAPVHPMLAALAFPGFGDTHRRIMERLPYAQATIAPAHRRPPRRPRRRGPRRLRPAGPPPLPAERRPPRSGHRPP